MIDMTPVDLQGHLDAGETVFLKLWKKGCGACKLSIPAIERIEAEYSGQMLFGQICTDDFPEMLEVSGSDALPAFFVFKDRQQKGSFTGFKGLEKLRSFVAASISG